MKRTSLLIDPEIWAEFQKVADEEGMHRAQLLRQVMKRRVAEHRAAVTATA